MIQKKDKEPVACRRQQITHLFDTWKMVSRMAEKTACARALDGC
jgi:hypothetical protein